MSQDLKESPPLLSPWLLHVSCLPAVSMVTKCFLLSFLFQCHPDSVTATCRQGKNRNVCVGVPSCVSDLYACSPVAELVCVCVYWVVCTNIGGRCAHTNTYTHIEWSSQLMQECRDCCQFLLPHYRSLSCGSGHKVFFSPIIHSECFVSLGVDKTISTPTEIRLHFCLL